MTERNDPMGRAIADYQQTGKAERLRVFSPEFDEDEIPVETLFRSFDDMPDIEKTAIALSKGKVLDVGAASGCHSLVLQENGLDVTAIDISPLSVQVMKERGVKKAVEQDFFTVKEKYDTILMLMNGIGIAGTVDRLPDFFKHIDKILKPGGQLFCDSSDISYVYEFEEGFIEYPEDKAYFGELSYRMQYKDTVGDEFPWLYIDADTFHKEAENAGFNLEVVAMGEHYDYLARITRK